MYVSVCVYPSSSGSQRRCWRRQREDPPCCREGARDARCGGTSSHSGSLLSASRVGLGAPSLPWYRRNIIKYCKKRCQEWGLGAAGSVGLRVARRRMGCGEAKARGERWVQVSHPQLWPLGDVTVLLLRWCFLGLLLKRCEMKSGWKLEGKLRLACRGCDIWEGSRAVSSRSPRLSSRQDLSKGFRGEQGGGETGRACLESIRQLAPDRRTTRRVCFQLSL